MNTKINSFLQIFCPLKHVTYCETHLRKSLQHPTLYLSDADIRVFIEIY